MLFPTPPFFYLLFPIILNVSHSILNITTSIQKCLDLEQMYAQIYNFDKVYKHIDSISLYKVYLIPTVICNMFTCSYQHYFVLCPHADEVPTYRT